ncbi:MAG: PAS domain-containing protein [Candidatus Eremiobacteraeota bacterium]|nr:PAS domain-containing protein [Candidatus Eremiobacteraeota bacterium]
MLTYTALRAADRDSAAMHAAAPEPVERDQDRAARLVEGLPFAAFTLGPDGRVRVFNTAAAALFGVDRARAVGRAIIEVIPSVDLERMLQAALAGETRTRDIVLGAVARQRYFGVTAQPYESGAMAIASDRTALLAAERMRSEFIGNVSHELRTPLSAMKLMLETVLISEDDAEARALFLPQIQGEVERMIRLVEDLLDLARSESGTLQLRVERFDLGDMAASTVNTFAHRADGLGVELELDAPAAVPVDADRGALTQVLVNLVDNALRHTPAGGNVAVEVGREGADAVLRVRDTGAGIPYADLPRVFERFYVVDRSRSREHGGTGLGLAIAKHLVESHGGSLVAESVYGTGSTFTMRVPAPAGLSVSPDIKER